jgi:hypothetical protein
MIDDNTDGQGLSVRTFIAILLAIDRSLSVADLLSKLNSVGFKPSTILVASLRASFHRHFKFLDDAGLIGPKVVNKNVGVVNTKKSLPRVRLKTKSLENKDLNRGSTKRRILDLLRQGVRKARIAERVGVSRAYVTQIASRGHGSEP